MSNHPITPPPELVEEWFNNSPIDRGLTLATQAAQWGADQELDACCEWVESNFGQLPTHNLRQFRRPKPPSLKEVALEDLRSIELLQKEHKMVACTFNIRRALEVLPNE